jgi:hypothetical protein
MAPAAVRMELGWSGRSPCRRNARNRWRSLLVILMIALPILATQRPVRRALVSPILCGRPMLLAECE